MRVVLFYMFSFSALDLWHIDIQTSDIHWQMYQEKKDAFRSGYRQANLDIISDLV